VGDCAVSESIGELVVISVPMLVLVSVGVLVDIVVSVVVAGVSSSGSSFSQPESGIKRQASKYRSRWAISFFTLPPH
jgi:hypothetical protein